jgi:hypothetical protein
MFLANTFSVAQRRVVAEHAYRQTRAMLRSRRTKLAAQLARHGISMRDDVLDDAERHLVDKRSAGSKPVRALQRLEEVLDDLESMLPTRARPHRRERSAA